MAGKKGANTGNLYRHEGKRQAFLKSIARQGSPVVAMQEAGYPKCHRFKSDKVLVKMVEDMRAKVVEITAYDAKAALEEADRAILFAIQTENANAYVKAVELKSRIQGLLVEKVQVAVSGFGVHISGIDEPKQLPPPLVSHPLPKFSNLTEDTDPFGGENATNDNGDVDPFA